MVTALTPERRLHEAVSTVPDPELPIVTIADLGILRHVEIESGGRAVVTITPTYSGCPAMDVIRHDVAAACLAAGYPDVEVRTAFSPAWTTDWMTDRARARLRDYGIAPPGEAPTPGEVAVSLSVRCPQCGSGDTRETSRFGSTACKSLHACNACGEPFDHFKAI